jgi:Flp pilus assembly protein TadD
VLEVQLGNLPGARAHLERAVELQPRNAQALHDLGVLNLKEGRLDDAGACFRQALALNPTQDVTRRALQRVEQLKAARPAAAPQTP